MKVVIAGGTGFIGRASAELLRDNGHTPIILTRRPSAMGDSHVHWDGRTVGPWAECLEGADALVNLTGRSVDCVKTPDHCDEILRSRVEPVVALGKAIQQLSVPPRVWVQMSTAHYYGDPPHGTVCSEDSAAGYGLAPFVARSWESAFFEACPPSIRQVVLRTSFVLGPSGGALGKLAYICRLGLGGTVGHGTQGISWIHHVDMSRLIWHALETSTMEGVYIATAPNPVSNKNFMRELRMSLGMPIGLPAPSLAVRLAAPLLMRTDPELALYGRYCVSSRLPHSGFQFRFPELPAALADIFG